MKELKTKREMLEELEQARRMFYANGRRVQRLAPGDKDRVENAKPRKQRLKMFA